MKRSGCDNGRRSVCTKKFSLLRSNLQEHLTKAREATKRNYVGTTLRKNTLSHVVHLATRSELSTSLCVHIKMFVMFSVNATRVASAF